MNANAGPGVSGTTLSPPPGPPGRVLRAVAFTPAVRGYPGGIADMAADQGDLIAGDEFDSGAGWAAGPAAAVERAGQPAAPPPAPGTSVWQQSVAVWQEAGIDWLREARREPARQPVREPGAEDRDAVEDDMQHTEPIPVIPAFDPPGQAQPAGRTAGPASATAPAMPKPRSAQPAEGTGSTRQAEAQSSTAQPSPAQPSTAQPSTAQPGARQPGSARPVPAQPGAVAPAAGQAEADEDLIVLSGAAATAGSGETATAPGSASGAAAAGAPRAGSATDEAAAADAAAAAAGAASTAGGAAAAGTAGSGPTPVAVGAAAAGAGPVAGGAETGAAPTVAGAVTDGAPPAAAGAVAGAAVTHEAGAAGPASAATEAGAEGTRTGAEGTRTGAEGTRTGAHGARTVPGTSAQPSRGEPGGGKPSRRAVVVAAITGVALVAGTVTGIVVARSGGPSRPTFGLVTPYPPAALADSAFAGPAGASGPPPVLTGIAGAGRTIVAVGSQGAAPESLPLILDSQNGGRTWARAALGPTSAAPGAALGSGAIPVLAVRGPNGWLALGQQSAWTSANGQTWQTAPALPMSAGDKILGLARTRSGFIAVGENVPAPPGSGMTSAVLWTSPDGRTWQRKHATTLQFDAGGGSVASLRWAAYRGGVIIVGGEISRPVVGRRGKRRVITNVESPGLWRTRDGGVTWRPVKLPVSHGAATGLAGLAASGPAFVAIRPGRNAAGHRDAVAYTSPTGAGWRYAGRLTGGRRAPLHVITVAATDQGFVVAGTTGASRVAFVSAEGRGWHKTADQGRSASTIVTSVTVAPGPVAVAAGFRHRPGSRAASPSPLLLLTGAGAAARRTQVGQPALAAAGAAADVTVNSIAASGAERVAAGAADGAPALWSASANGPWRPAAVSLPPAWRSGSLASVVHGRAGWLAIGTVAQPGLPAVGAALMSADGRTWRAAPGAAALSAAGAAQAQVAAGPTGYVAVGSQAGPGGVLAPAAWYSAGMSTWSRAAVAGPGQAGTAGQMLAVTADSSGFVAAGSVGSVPVVWTSRTGAAWQPAALPLPRGAASAVLTEVAALGGRVVAAGDYVPNGASGAGAGPVPFAAASGDGGRHWREVVLRTPGGTATVTALTATTGGFVAAGLSGAGGHQAVISWLSADGLSWQGGRPVRGPGAVGGVTRLTTLNADHGVLTGAGNTVTQSGVHPVLWHARLR